MHCPKHKRNYSTKESTIHMIAAWRTWLHFFLSLLTLIQLQDIFSSYLFVTNMRTQQALLPQIFLASLEPILPTFSQLIIKIL